MLQQIKQRKYIQDFLDFTGTFLITEKASLNEVDLVLANLGILRDRILAVKETTVITPILNE